MTRTERQASRWGVLLALLGPLPAAAGLRVPLRRAAADQIAPAYRAVPFNPFARLHAFGGVQWLGLLELGQPRQRFTVTMDTGSSDLLVIGRSCADPDCRGSASFDPARSASFRPCAPGNGTLDCRFTEDYAGGTARGSLGSDEAVLAGLRARAFTFGVIASLDMEGANLTAWDGILGLTFDNVEAGRPPTLLSALYEEGALSARQLSFLLLDPAGGPDPFEAAGTDQQAQTSMLEVGGMTMVPPGTAITCEFDCIAQVLWLNSSALVSARCQVGPAAEPAHGAGPQRPARQWLGHRAAALHGLGRRRGPRLARSELRWPDDALPVMRGIPRHGHVAHRGVRQRVVGRANRGRRPRRRVLRAHPERDVGVRLRARRQQVAVRDDRVRQRVDADHAEPEPVHGPRRQPLPARLLRLQRDGDVAAGRSVPREPVRGLRLRPL